MKFIEPEEQYKVDKTNSGNVKTRITLLTSLIIFGSLPILAVQMNLFQVYGKEKIDEYCFEDNTYRRTDEDVPMNKKSLKALKDHLETLQELDGFISAGMESKQVGMERKKPFIKLVFEKKSTDIDRIPETICGFEVILTKEKK